MLRQSIFSNFSELGEEQDCSHGLVTAGFDLSPIIQDEIA